MYLKQSALNITFINAIIRTTYVGKIKKQNFHYTQRTAWYTIVAQSFVVELISKLTVCLVTQSYPTLWDPLDCSPPGSSVHWISQARILEWVAISFSRGSSRPRD